MMAVPVIISILSGIAGAGGIALHVKGKWDNIYADEKNRQILNSNKRKLAYFEECSDHLQNEMEDLGKQRTVIEKNFKVFIDAFEKIHNRPEYSKSENGSLPVYDFKEIKSVSDAAEVVIGEVAGDAAGAMLGSVAAGGIKSAVMAVGKAGSGAKINVLKGNAKLRAALAALGGGPKANGGGGIELGKLVLNAAEAGVGVLIKGFAMAFAASVARKKADDAAEAENENERLIQNASDMQLEIAKSAYNLKSVSVRLCNGIYKKLVFQMKELVKKKEDWNEFSDDEKLLVENNIRTVQILNYLNNVPLYSVLSFNKEGEIKEIEPNTETVNLAISKAKNYMKGRK